MPPRKSLPRSAASRSDTAGSASLSGPSGSQKASGQTTGNRTTKSLPAISMPESVTPAFKRQKIESRVLDDDERGILIHEVSSTVERSKRNIMLIPFSASRVLSSKIM